MKKPSESLAEQSYHSLKDKNEVQAEPSRHLLIQDLINLWQKSWEKKSFKEAEEVLDQQLLIPSTLKDASRAQIILILQAVQATNQWYLQQKSDIRSIEARYDKLNPKEIRSPLLGLRFSQQLNFYIQQGDLYNVFGYTDLAKKAYQSAWNIPEQNHTPAKLETMHIAQKRLLTLIFRRYIEIQFTQIPKESSEKYTLLSKAFYDTYPLLQYLNQWGNNQILDSIYKFLNPFCIEFIEQCDSALHRAQSNLQKYEKEFANIKIVALQWHSHQQFELAEQIYSLFTKNATQKAINFSGLSWAQQHYIKCKTKESIFLSAEDKSTQIEQIKDWIFQYKQANLEILNPKKEFEDKNLFSPQYYYSKKIIAILQQVLQFCVERLGKPPCQFNIMASGTLAQHVLQPASDVDIMACLISDIGKQSDPYFKSLWQLLTNILAGLSPQASVDPADITDFEKSTQEDAVANTDSKRNNSKYAAINTPLGLLGRIVTLMPPSDSADNYSLYHAVLLYSYESDESLFNQYQQELSLIMQKPSQMEIALNKGLSISVSGSWNQVASKYWLKEHSRDWKICKDKGRFVDYIDSHEKKEFSVINIKERYLNPLAYLVSDLGLWASVLKTSKTGLETNIELILEALTAKNILVPHIARFFKTIYRYLLNYRTTLHQDWLTIKCHDEKLERDMVYLENQNLPPILQLTALQLDAKQKNILDEIEQTLLVPAYEQIEAFIQNSPPQFYFKNNWSKLSKKDQDDAVNRFLSFLLSLNLIDPTDYQNCYLYFIYSFWPNPIDRLLDEKEVETEEKQGFFLEQENICKEHAYNFCIKLQRGLDKTGLMLWQQEQIYFHLMNTVFSDGQTLDQLEPVAKTQQSLLNLLSQPLEFLTNEADKILNEKTFSQTVKEFNLLFKGNFRAKQEGHSSLGHLAIWLTGLLDKPPCIFQVFVLPKIIHQDALSTGHKFRRHFLLGFIINNANLLKHPYFSYFAEYFSECANLMSEGTCIINVSQASYQINSQPLLLGSLVELATRKLPLILLQSYHPMINLSKADFIDFHRFLHLQDIPAKPTLLKSSAWIKTRSWQERLLQLTSSKQPDTFKGRVAEIKWSSYEADGVVKNYSRFLPTELMQSLFDSPGGLIGSIQKDTKHSLPGLRTTRRITAKFLPNKDPSLDPNTVIMYLKIDPLHPLRQLQTLALTQRMMSYSHEGSLADIQLINPKNPAEPYPRISVFLSAPAGFTFCEEEEAKLVQTDKLSYPKEVIVLNQSGKDYFNRVIEKLDAYSFTQAVLQTWLCSYEDDQLRNLAFELFVNSQGEPKFRIVSFDTDTAFGPAWVYEDKKAIGNKPSIRLKLKSFLFCLNQMEKPLNKQAITEFLQLDPINIITRWLEHLEKLAIMHPTKEHDLPKNIGKLLLERWQRLQKALTLPPKSEDPLAYIFPKNHFELLEQIDPLLAACYRDSYYENQTVYDRFKKLPLDYLLVSQIKMSIGGRLQSDSSIAKNQSLSHWPITNQDSNAFSAKRDFNIYLTNNRSQKFTDYFMQQIQKNQLAQLKIQLDLLLGELQKINVQYQELESQQSSQQIELASLETAYSLVKPFKTENVEIAIISCSDDKSYETELKANESLVIAKQPHLLFFYRVNIASWWMLIHNGDRVLFLDSLDNNIDWRSLKNILPKEMIFPIADSVKKNLITATKKHCQNLLSIQELKIKTAKDQLQITINRLQGLQGQKQQIEQKQKIAATKVVKDSDPSYLLALSDASLRQDVLNQLQWTKLAENPNSVLNEVLRILTYGNFEHLNLQGCRPLPEDTFINALQYSPLLITLNIAGCNNLTEKTILALAKSCINIQRINAQSLPNLKQLWQGRTIWSLGDPVKFSRLTHLHLPQSGLERLKLKSDSLIYLNLSDCKELQVVNLDAPRLKNLRLTGNIKLSEFEVAQNTFPNYQKWKSRILKSDLEQNRQSFLYLGLIAILLNEDNLSVDLKQAEYWWQEFTKLNSSSQNLPYFANECIGLLRIHKYRLNPNFDPTEALTSINVSAIPAMDVVSTRLAHLWLFAAKSGYLSWMQCLLRLNHSINFWNFKNENHDTAIHLALENHKNYIVEFFLTKDNIEKKSIDMKAKGTKGRTPFLNATFYRNKEGMLLLLGASKQLWQDVDDEKQTALHLAIIKADETIIQMCLLSDIAYCQFMLANSNIFGRTPFLEAAYYGYNNVMESMLIYNSRLTEHHDLQGKSAIDIANEQKHEHIARIFKSRINPTPWESPALAIIYSRGSSTESVAESGLKK